MGGKGYGKQAYGAMAPAEPVVTPSVLWITLNTASKILDDGYPPIAPVLTYDKAATVFSEAHSILSDLVGDISAEVIITHDTDWDVFPEVGAAVQQAGGEENCLGIAACPSQGKWAVALAGGKKGRENAGKLALALALAADSEQIGTL